MGALSAAIAAGALAQGGGKSSLIGKLEKARQRGERVGEGHALRLLGDIAAHPDRGDVDSAEAHYREALALTEALGLRPLAARCHLGLGMLYWRAGTRAMAQEYLGTARTMFGEMDMPYWREQAEMALTVPA